MNTISENFARTTVSLYGDAGVEWLENLSNLLSEFEQRWSLTIQPPFEHLSYNYIAPAVRADGTEVVFKAAVPNPELITEIEALNLYDGRGICRLLADDRDRGVLLLERLQPGTMLSTLADDEEATRIAARVMRQLWRPVPPDHPFRTVNDWAAGMEKMRQHFDGGTGPLPADLVEKAEGLFAELLSSMDEIVLLHGDLHHYNILQAERQPWLAIDPKGIVGEPAYEVGALLGNPIFTFLEWSHLDRITARRVDILAEELGFDRVRMLGWGLTQAVLSAWWCIEDNMDCWDEAIRCAEIFDEVMG
jgi:streptomycin 6-kinase